MIFYPKNVIIYYADTRNIVNRKVFNFFGFIHLYRIAILYRETQVYSENYISCVSTLLWGGYFIFHNFY